MDASRLRTETGSPGSAVLAAVVAVFVAFALIILAAGIWLSQQWSSFVAADLTEIYGLVQKAEGLEPEERSLLLNTIEATRDRARDGNTPDFFEWLDLYESVRQRISPDGSVDVEGMLSDLSRVNRSKTLEPEVEPRPN